MEATLPGAITEEIQSNGDATTAVAVAPLPEMGKAASRYEESGPSDKKEWYIFWQVNFLSLYYLLLLFLAFWFLLDTWSGNFSVMRSLGLKGESLTNPLLKTISYIVVGGFFGSILFQIRQLYHWYIKKDAYSYRWFGKYITAPWESAAMALVVMAIIRGGVALFGGSGGTDVTATNNFAAFGTGALVGFGMRDAVGWIGNIVRSIFITERSVLPDDEAQEPMRKGQTEGHAA